MKDLFEQHLEQQLTIELWSQNREISLSVPDFTDYVFRQKQVVGDYQELDHLYQSWTEFMR